MLCVVNWLTECLFQPKAPCDSEDAATVATSQVETLDVEENVEGQTHAGALQENVEADPEAEGDEVWESGV
jgi:hypothetical protein